MPKKTKQQEIEELKAANRSLEAQNLSMKVLMENSICLNRVNDLLYRFRSLESNALAISEAADKGSKDSVAAFSCYVTWMRAANFVRLFVNSHRSQNPQPKDPMQK